MFGRNKSTTHTQQMLNELAESYGHLRLAAGHVAGGAAEKVTPTYDRAKIAAARGLTSTVGTLSPFYSQLREGAATARKGHDVAHQRSRVKMVIGLVSAGAAAGAAGAVLVKRRRAAQWEEYEPMPAIGEPGAEGVTHKVAAGAAAVAETVSSQAGKLAETLHTKAGESATAKAGHLADKTADKAGEAAASLRDKAEEGSGPFAPFAEDVEPPKSGGGTAERYTLP